VQLITVAAEADGQRIDNFLMRILKGVPRSHLYRVLRRGEVRVNKGRIKADYRVRCGDVVRIPPLHLAPLAPPGRAPAPQLAQLERAVLFEDERLLVLDKPSGLAVHGGSGLSYGLIEALRQLRPGHELELVHRLDRDTSGCIIISKRRSALRELHQLIRDNQLDKRYLALLIGTMPRAEVTVDAPLKKNVLSSGERVVRVDPVDGKPARSRFRQLQRFEWQGHTLTLVEVQLITGRTHQIRVHAAHLGAPLAGDPKYGDEVMNRALKAVGLTRLFLHAATLRIPLAHSTAPLRGAKSPPAPLFQRGEMQNPAVAIGDNALPSFEKSSLLKAEKENAFFEIDAAEKHSFEKGTALKPFSEKESALKPTFAKESALNPFSEKESALKPFSEKGTALKPPFKKGGLGGFELRIEAPLPLELARVLTALGIKT
jgi:23S rRNA pseudouridine955/2504/2580 synthase